ncbi:MAG TPA: NINE protein [Chthoniobacteraceae bacterium]|jgi:TM2 domain-containing membrane protein YozV/DNA-directed RNA polymerase subunit RPC12/RpoP|nr:NINE protein [Chthoniobacteraceae bacterium]
MKQSTSFIFECPACDDLIDVERELVGIEAKCPHCRQKIFVPKPCPFCGSPILATAKKCPDCGEYLDPRLAARSGGHGAKSLALYIVLGLFFGGFGIHNFYAGRYVVAVIQLGLFLLLLLVFPLGVIISAWAFAELFLVRTDGFGQPLI